MSWEAVGKCRRAATVQRCYLCCEEGACVFVCVHLACPCSERLFVLGGGAECVCVCVCVCACWEGSRAVCLKVPKGSRLSSCPFTLSWKDCILSIWGRETSPSGNGAPKVGKLMTRLLNFSTTQANRQKKECIQSTFTLLHEIRIKVDWPKARMSSLCTAQVTVLIREAEVRPANIMLYRKTM